MKVFKRTLSAVACLVAAFLLALQVENVHPWQRSLNILAVHFVEACCNVLI